MQTSRAMNVVGSRPPLWHDSTTNSKSETRPRTGAEIANAFEKYSNVFKKTTTPSISSAAVFDSHHSLDEEFGTSFAFAPKVKCQPGQFTNRPIKPQDGFITGRDNAQSQMAALPQSTLHSIFAPQNATFSDANDSDTLVRHQPPRKEKHEDKSPVLMVEPTLGPIYSPQQMPPPKLPSPISYKPLGSTNKPANWFPGLVLQNSDKSSVSDAGSISINLPLARDSPVNLAVSTVSKAASSSQNPNQQATDAPICWVAKENSSRYASSIVGEDLEPLLVKPTQQSRRHHASSSVKTSTHKGANIDTRDQADKHNGDFVPDWMSPYLGKNQPPNGSIVDSSTFNEPKKPTVGSKYFGGHKDPHDASSVVISSSVINEPRNRKTKNEPVIPQKHTSPSARALSRQSSRSNISKRRLPGGGGGGSVIGPSKITKKRPLNHHPVSWRKEELTNKMGESFKEYMANQKDLLDGADREITLRDAQIKDLEKELTQTHSNNKQLKTKLEKADKELASLRHSYTLLTDQERTYQSQVSKLKDENDKHIEKYQKLNDKCSLFRGRINEAIQEQQDVFLRSKDFYRKAIHETRQAKIELDAETAKLSQEFEKSREHSSSLKERIETEKANAQLLEDQYKAEIEEWKTKFKDQEVGLAAMHQDQNLKTVEFEQEIKKFADAIAKLSNDREASQKLPEDCPAVSHTEITEKLGWIMTRMAVICPEDDPASSDNQKNGKNSLDTSRMRIKHTLRSLHTELGSLNKQLDRDKRHRMDDKQRIANLTNKLTQAQSLSSLPGEDEWTELTSTPAATSTPTALFDITSSFSDDDQTWQHSSYFHPIEPNLTRVVIQTPSIVGDGDGDGDVDVDVDGGNPVAAPKAPLLIAPVPRSILRKSSVFAPLEVEAKKGSEKNQKQTISSHMRVHEPSSADSPHKGMAEEQDRMIVNDIASKLISKSCVFGDSISKSFALDKLPVEQPLLSGLSNKRQEPRFSREKSFKRQRKGDFFSWKEAGRPLVDDIEDDFEVSLVDTGKK